MQAYLTFNGNAAEALAFYAQALGGKVAFSMTFGDSPMGAETPAEYKNKIMHATLEARGQQLMASDAPPGWAFEGHKGFSLSVTGKDVRNFDVDSIGYYTFLNKDTVVYYKLTEPHY